MSGSKLGAAKRLATMRARPDGVEKLKQWASLGGRLSSNRTFSTNPEIASEAGKKSAIIRRKNRDERLKLAGENGEVDGGKKRSRRRQKGDSV